MLIEFLQDKTNSEQLVFETPHGEKSLVKLPDGSEVWLNASSRLIYNSFSSNRRQVNVYMKGAEQVFKIRTSADSKGSLLPC